jgi:protein-disulfide isomerase
MSKRNKAAERAARVAALKAEQERKERQRRLLTIGGVVGALLVIVVVAVWLQMRGGDIDETADAPAGATPDYGLKLGEADADHEVVIYEDFLCPACKAFEDASADTLDTAVADGRATVEYRPLDFLSRFGDYSQRTANAFAVVLDAAGPDVAKEFHDILYAEQPAEEGDHPDDAWLIDKAVEAGATESEVADGIENLEFEAWVGNGVKAATSAGIQGTPTVIVDGEAIDASALAEALE